ncbi:uncharacterized protein [Drosophila suzukii]|uniref:Uncharacterized protein n=1 Tax=Drosophila suzukii TaxID=28584 RepID=A0AB39ZQD4_DROSZ
MSFGAINLLVIFLLSVPGILGQCIECKARGQFHCQTNYTGYYCAPGAYINENEISKDKCQTKSRTYDSPFSPCTPYPFEITYIETFCCLYSPSLGCQLALNPGIFSKEKLPVSRCEDCMGHCQCLNKGAPFFQPWIVVFLLGISTLLTQSIYLITLD